MVNYKNIHMKYVKQNLEVTYFSPLVITIILNTIQSFSFTRIIPLGKKNFFHSSRFGRYFCCYLFCQFFGMKEQWAMLQNEATQANNGLSSAVQYTVK